MLKEMSIGDFRLRDVERKGFTFIYFRYLFVINLYVRMLSLVDRMFKV